MDVPTCLEGDLAMPASYQVQDGDWTYYFISQETKLSGPNDKRSKETVESIDTAGPFKSYINVNIDFAPIISPGKSYKVNDIFAIDLASLENIAGGRIIIDTNILINTKYFEIIYKGTKIADDYFHIDIVLDSNGYSLDKVSYNGTITERDTIDDIILKPTRAFFQEKDVEKIYSPYVSGNPLVWAKSYDSYLYNDKYFDGSYLDLTYDIERTAGAEIFTNQGDDIHLGDLTSKQRSLILEGADTMDSLDGADRVRLPDQSDWIVNEGFFSYAGQKAFFGNLGDDTIQGGNLRDRIHGGDGADTLKGGDNLDRIFGGDGSDKIYGEKQDDVLDGGDGNDRHDGGDGVDTVSLSGKGSQYTFYFSNIFNWKSVGPDGVDRSLLIEEYDFSNREISDHQLFRHLVSSQDAEHTAIEIQRLIKKDTILSEAISHGQDLVKNSLIIQTTADAALTIKTMQAVIGGLLSIANPLYGIAFSIGQLGVSAADWKFDNTSSEEDRREGFALQFIDSFLGVVSKLFPKFEEFSTVAQAALAIRDLDKINSEWRNVQPTLKSTIEQLEDWRLQQDKLQSKILQLEIDLRDKASQNLGLPKVRYDGQSGETPSVLDDIAKTKIPDPFDYGLASFDSSTSTVSSWSSLTLQPDQANHTLLGDADIASGGNALSNTLLGNSGANRLAGKAAADILKGGSGSDVLYGGEGADELFGGGGADTFIFSAILDSKTSGRDKIYDFSRQQKDKIDLGAIDADTDLKGNQAFEYIGSRKFSGDEGDLRSWKSGGDTYVSGDINGDLKADFAFVIAASINLKVSDFIL